MSEFELLELPHPGDSRGNLTVQEDALPFVVARTYWITGADGQTRGGHRHKVTRQALVAVTGAVSIFLDDGHHSKTVVLDRPWQCLIVEPDDWHTMHFGPGSTLLVMASNRYDRSDYIDPPYR